MAHIQCLVDSPKPDDLAIIFIHGLNGDVRETWMIDKKDESTLWPKWLASDLDCSVWLLGYDAKLSSWQDNAMPLPDQGDAVLEELHSEFGLKNRPLLLIGHSMGGLLIKTLIHHGRTKGITRYENIIKRIQGISFVATPHNGSQLATLAKYASFLLRTNPQVGNMQTHEAHLRSLNQQFLAYFNDKKTNIAVRTYAETKGILIGKKVFGFNLGSTKLIVDPNSSEPHVPGEIAIRLSEDHSSICKLKDKNQTLYKSLLAFIKEDVLPKCQNPKSQSIEREEVTVSAKTPEQIASHPVLSDTGQTKVFISYSHDSDAHRDFVRRLAKRLRADGLNCVIDQYINGFPANGWQHWMEDQVEEADFVLLVCTETYLRRYRGKETSGGNGVTFEGLVISQTLYDAYYHNTKFVPVLPEGGDFNHVPLPLKQYSTYTIPTNYDKLFRYISNQPEHNAPQVGSMRVMRPAQEVSNNDSFKEESTKPPPIDKVQVTKLPYTNSHLFGREKELDMIDDAWNEGVNILVLKAMGGTGKTALLKRWLDYFVADNCRGATAVFTWSFYSQGSAENKQTSTDDFFESALRFFGYTDEALPAPHEIGIKLARLVAAHRTLLILDGLEPLQYPIGSSRGELKDQSLKALLQQLAANNAGLCLISSRQTVEELKGKPEKLVLAHDLEQLQEKDGVALLQSIGVKGSDAELRQAVNEVAGHALALNLLGNYIKTVLNGDIRQRDKIPGLMAERNDGKHAEKMLAAYEAHLQGSPALSVLYLLGLFDRPVSPGAVLCLKQAKIPALTDQLDSDVDWCYAIDDLREQNLLNTPNTDYPDNLDSHPLIREYFGRQLQSQQPEAWQQAHARLYEYYKALPRKEFPDTLEEMKPLFSAVVHGCIAGLEQKALKEVYWPRVQRSGENYACNKLGVFSDELSTVAYFFTVPWRVPAESLGDIEKAGVLNWAGVRLRALGRLHEAIEPIQANVEMNLESQNWVDLSMNSANLSELLLILGEIPSSINSAKQSVEYAERAGGSLYLVGTRVTHANALHQSGKLLQAFELFKSIEVLQQEQQPEFPILYAQRGFYYCDLLLAQGETSAVLKRATQTLEWAKQQGAFLLEIALNKLLLGRANLQHSIQKAPPYLPLSLNNQTSAAEWLEQAVAELRSAGYQDQLPLGLLARAILFRYTHKFILARQDLQEVYDIAEPSGMHLHLTDYHLEMARLILEESKVLTPNPDTQKAPITSPKPESTLTLQDHINQAQALITATGYHRRDAELADLISKASESTI